MSRLIDELKKTERTSNQPMGFRTSRQVSSGPRLRLIAGTDLKESLPTNSTKGADAVLLLPEKSLLMEAVKTTVKQFKNIPWGIKLKNATSNKATSLIKEGCDFFIFPATALVSSIPTDGDTGRIIEVELSLDDGLLRAIDNIPVDAIIVNTLLKTDDSLVWHELITFQHITNLLTKPVIVRLPIDISESDIRALWEAGADAVLVKIDARKPDGIKNLRKLIDSLPARKSLKKGSMEALLPYSREAKAAETEPEEEDEDWE